MTNREKKEYLQKYRAAVVEADRLDNEIKKWRSTAERTTTAIRLIPASGGSGSDRLQNAVEQIDNLTRELGEKRAETVRLRREIEDVISTAKDDRLQSLLRFRYIDGMTWEAIAVALQITYQWVCKLHGNALEKIRVS